MYESEGKGEGERTGAIQHIALSLITRMDIRESFNCSFSGLLKNPPPKCQVTALGRLF